MLKPSENLTRVGGSTSNMLHSCDYWQKASVACHVDFSTGFMECSFGAVNGLPPEEEI
jgi:hypothetical protein